MIRRMYLSNIPCEGGFIAHAKSKDYRHPVIVLTEEKLRECFEAGIEKQHRDISDPSCHWIEDFDQWLATQLESKEGEG